MRCVHPPAYPPAYRPLSRCLAAGLFRCELSTLDSYDLQIVGRGASRGRLVCEFCVHTWMVTASKIGKWTIQSVGHVHVTTLSSPYVAWTY